MGAYQRGILPEKRVPQRNVKTALQTLFERQMKGASHDLPTKRNRPDKPGTGMYGIHNGEAAEDKI